MGQNAGDDDIIQTVTKAHLLEAELAALTERLREPSTLSQQLTLSGQDPAAYWQQSMKRRTELVRTLGAMRGAAEEQSFSRAILTRQSLVQDVLDLLVPWQKLPVPFMTEGVEQEPGVPGTSGGIGTAALDVGIAAYAGTMEDDGTQNPLDPKFWIHTWRCIIPFLPAPALGWFSYRCGVSALATMYQDSMLSGSLTEFVTVGTTKDTLQPITNWNTVGWPVNATLPSNTLEFGGDVPITGSLLLGQGERAALGVIVGVVASVASGYIQFLSGSLNIHLVLPPGDPGKPTDYGLIEYRFVPRPVFEAVESIVSALRQ
jgi:hypothetical protein